MKFEREKPTQENENEIQDQKTETEETKETNKEQLERQLRGLSMKFNEFLGELEELQREGGQELLVEEKRGERREEVLNMVGEISEVSHRLNEIYKEEENFEREGGVESQEADREIIEKIVDELTEKKIEGGMESLMESLRKEVAGDTMEFIERLLEKDKDEIRKESKSFLSMDEEKRIQLKQFLGERKQEAEAQGKKLNRLYERRIQMIQMLEEAEKENEE